MKKKKFVFILILIISFYSYSQDRIVDIEKIVFKGRPLRIIAGDTEGREVKRKYCLAYSSFLPTGGVYSIVDNITAKEAIVQIGSAKVRGSLSNLYLPDSVFDFFAKSYKNEVDTINVKIKFLAWNKREEESIFLDLQRLIIKPDRSVYEIRNNGLDKYYIQLGAFSYYQNAYPIIIEMMPFLKTVPNFYLVKKEVNRNGKITPFFRILVGPYSKNDANNIALKINAAKKTVVFVRSGQVFINENKESIRPRE